MSRRARISSSVVAVLVFVALVIVHGPSGPAGATASITEGVNAPPTIAVEGPDHSLWVYWEGSNAQWYGPLGVGASGSTFSAPSVAVGPTGLPTIAAQGPDNSLWVYWEGSNAQWYGPLGVGASGSAFSAPSVDIGPTGQATIAVEGPDHSLWVYWEGSNAQWYGPLGVGASGSAFSAPSVIDDTPNASFPYASAPYCCGQYAPVTGTGLPTVAVEGPDDSLWLYWETSDAQWYGPLGAGAPGSTSGQPAAAIDPDQEPMFATQAADGSVSLYSGEWVATEGVQWPAPQQVFAPGWAQSAPSLAADSLGDPVVAVEGPSKTLSVDWEASTATGAQWYGPLDIGAPGSTVSAPSIATGPDDTFDVAARGPDQSLSVYWEATNAQWYGPLGVGAPGSDPTEAPSAAASSSS